MEWVSPVCLGSIPSVRFGHSAVVYKDTLVSFGGMGERESSADVSLLNPSMLCVLLVRVEDWRSFRVRRIVFLSFCLC